MFVSPHVTLDLAAIGNGSLTDTHDYVLNVPVRTVEGGFVQLEDGESHQVAELSRNQFCYKHLPSPTPTKTQQTDKNIDVKC